MGQVWFNGTILDKETASLPIADRGFLLSDGIFDTMLGIKGRIVDGEAHMKRLVGACKALKIPLNYSAYALLQEAERLLPSDDVSALRITVTRGVGPRGLALPDETNPTILMVPNPGKIPNQEDQVSFVDAWCSPEYRRNEGSRLSRLKCLNYLENLMALDEAKAQGTQEAILLNNRGNLVTGSASNLFMLTDQALVTPSLEEGCLDGITRKVIFALAKDLGIKVLETVISPADRMHSKVLFQCNSLMGMRGIRAINYEIWSHEPSTLEFVSLYQAFQARLGSFSA